LEVPFRLPPGGEKTFEAYVAVSTKIDELRPALSLLYAHGIADWISVASAFWKERLGSMETQHCLGDKSQIAVDLHIRSIIDNFNCIQTNSKGDVTICWQGAPSHNCGRFWGIDLDPTCGSIMRIVPELGKPAILYGLSRVRPAWLPCVDYSIGILVAPVILAKKYV
jgi:hypothetical protein